MTETGFEKASVKRQRLNFAATRVLLDAPLPCVAVSPNGLLLESNAAAKYLLPLATVGQSICTVLRIDLANLIAAADKDYGAITALVDDGCGATTPLLAQPLRLEDGGVLLLLSALATFQAAEEARFEKTPYSIVRLDDQGVIRFANAEARTQLSNQAELVGREFASLFPEGVADDIRKRQLEVIATEFARTVRVTEGSEITIGGRSFHSERHLTLVPFLAPGGRVMGVVVHIQKQIMDALRFALQATVGDGAEDTQIATWPDRMRAVLDLLQLVVPHDRAVLSLVSEDDRELPEESRRWVRPILVHPPADPPYPRAWAPVPAAERRKMVQGPFALELPELLQSDPVLRADPLVARHAADGMISHAILPVPRGQPEVMLTLASRQMSFFEGNGAGTQTVWSDVEYASTQPPFRLLLSLGLEPLLVTVLRQVKREEERALRVMADRVNNARTIPEAAHGLLAAVVKHYELDQAAIFVVEPSAEGGQFRLFAQHPTEQADGTPHPLRLSDGYTQPLYSPPAGAPFDPARAKASGMLGAAVRAGTPVIAADISARDEQGNSQNFFLSVVKEQRSALIVPITLDNQTRWMLETVSRYKNAFHKDDGKQFGLLLRRLAREVARRRNALLNEMLIERIEQGVVITDAVGTLMRANARARDILGLPKAGDLPDGRRLSDHAADAETREWLAGTAVVGKVRLGPFGGLGSDVRVRRYQDQTETRDAVWMLDGADELDWIYDRTYIEATVQEVARQVRGPLLLASSLAGRLARTLQNEAAPVIEQVHAEIGRADITFERLAEAIGARRDPRRHDDQVDITALLVEIAAALPERDRKRLTGPATTSSLVVQGDRERLRFVLRTLLGHLLACNPERVAIRIAPEGDASEAQLRLHLTISDPRPAEKHDGDSPLEKVAQAAREAAGLAFGTAREVMQAHGGDIRRVDDGFDLKLPLSQREIVA